MSADIIDVLYRFRDHAGVAADKLRDAIAEAQAVLDKLDAFADGAEYSAQLAASSDAFPGHSALVPEGSGLVRRAFGENVGGTP